MGTLLRHTSGETARARGVYHSACRCHEELKIRAGEKFPRCSKCKSDVTWNFTRAFIPEETPHDKRASVI